MQMSSITHQMTDQTKMKACRTLMLPEVVFNNMILKQTFVKLKISLV